MTITGWLNDDVALRLTLTLTHFLWQGCVLALLAAGVGRWLQHKSANLRYASYLVILGLMVTCVPVTWNLIELPHFAVASQPSATTGEPAQADGPTADPTRPLRPISSESPVAVPSATPTGVAGPRLPMRAMPTASAARTTFAAGNPIRWRAAAPWAAGCYLAGLALMFIRLLRSVCRGFEVRRQSVSVDDPKLLDMVRRQAQRLRMRMIPAVAWCSRVSVPVVVGVLKPIILLPPALASGLAPQQLEALLAHELAHLRRFDLVFNLLQRIIEAVLFFHPAVWFVSRRAGLEREHACDDFVLAAGWPRWHYAEALVKMAELVCGNRSESSAQEFSRGATGLAATGRCPSQFKRRVMRLLELEPAAGIRWVPSGAALAAVAGAAILIAAIAVPIQANHRPKPGDEPAAVASASSNQATPKRESAAAGQPDLDDDPRRPWIVTGTVHDATGRPLPGVQLTASAGWGTLRRTGAAETDEQGRYRMRFGPGILMQREGEDPFQLQAAVIHARLAGYSEQTLCDQGELYAANRAPRASELDDWKYISPDSIIVAGQPREVDFVMLPAADCKVRILDIAGEPLKNWSVAIVGDPLPPASSALSSGRTDDQGWITFQEIPVNYAWRLEFHAPESRQSQISPLFQFPEPKEYTMVLKGSSHQPSGLTLWNFTSIEESDQDELLNRVLLDDPRTAPPVSPEQHAEVLATLRRVADVNHDWLIGPPAKIQEYGFTFHPTGHPDRKIDVNPRSGRSFTDIRGTAYVPAVGLLTGFGDKLVFRQFERRDGRLHISYAAGPEAPAIRTHYGIGVAGQYGNYVSSSIREGTLLIDEATGAVLEHHATSGLSEQFSDFVANRQGHLVPLRVRLTRNGVLMHDWRFAVYPPGLWLLDEALDAEGQLVARVDQVHVDGVAQQPVGQLPKASKPKSDDGSGRAPGGDDAPAGDENQDDVQSAIERALEYLKSQQQQNGAWRYTNETPHNDGVTALALLALAKTGTAQSDPSVQRGLEYLRNVQSPMTYNVALQTIVFCTIDPQQHATAIVRNIQWLVDTQTQEGEAKGGWSYGPRRSERSDGSNTRFAVWALDTARQAGFVIPQQTWLNAAEYWLNSQHADGTWGYQVKTKGTPAMTLAGIGCLASVKRATDDVELHGRIDQAISRAWKWHDASHTPASHLRLKNHSYYALHCLAVAGTLSDHPRSGDVDWYAEGIRELLARQNAAGAWEGDVTEVPVVATSLAILFAHSR